MTNQDDIGKRQAHGTFRFHCRRHLGQAFLGWLRALMVYANLCTVLLSEMENLESMSQITALH